MNLYPIFLKLDNQSCAVFGGGLIAEHKVKTLLSYGAHVTVVSPDLSPGLFALWKNGKIVCHYRNYRPGEIKGYRLVISATNDRDVNRQIFEEAHREGILVNVVDNPPLCDFYVPSIVRRGDLQLAISTTGQAPALAREIRKILENLFNDSYDEAIKIAGHIREHLKQDIPDEKKRKQIIDEVVVPKILAGIQNGTMRQVKKELQEWI